MNAGLMDGDESSIPLWPVAAPLDRRPHDPEDYVHRIGRTGRAGSAGTSISFADEEEAFYLPPIEAFMARKLDCIRPEEDWLILPKPVTPRKRRRPHAGRKAAS